MLMQLQVRGWMGSMAILILDIMEQKAIRYRGKSIMIMYLVIGILIGSDHILLLISL